MNWTNKCAAKIRRPAGQWGGAKRSQHDDCRRREFSAAVGEPGQLSGVTLVFSLYSRILLALAILVGNECHAAQPIDGQHEKANDSFLGAKAGAEWVVSGVKLCWCPPGKFSMGSPRNEPERRPGEDQVEVTLTKGFWMAKYEATQAEWKRVFGKLPGELTVELPEGDDLPVGNVNFAEVEAFCEKLTELARKSGEFPKDWEFRLPTEAQWEYACRAGTTTATSFGDKINSKQANFTGKPYNGGEAGPSLSRATKVGSYPANAWGLHDMHGNICEWCRDWFHEKLPGGVDPDLHDAKSTAQKNRTGDYSRSRRGGTWADPGWPCRSAFRQRFEPERRYDHIGFRGVAVHVPVQTRGTPRTP